MLMASINNERNVHKIYEARMNTIREKKSENNLKTKRIHVCDTHTHAQFLNGHF